MRPHVRPGWVAALIGFCREPHDGAIAVILALGWGLVAVMAITTLVAWQVG